MNCVIVWHDIILCATLPWPSGILYPNESDWILPHAKYIATWHVCHANHNYKRNPLMGEYTVPRLNSRLPSWSLCLIGECPWTFKLYHHQDISRCNRFVDTHQPVTNHEFMIFIHFNLFIYLMEYISPSSRLFLLNKKHFYRKINDINCY